MRIVVPDQGDPVPRCIDLTELPTIKQLKDVQGTNHTMPLRHEGGVERVILTTHNQLADRLHEFIGAHSDTGDQVRLEIWEGQEGRLEILDSGLMPIKVVNCPSIAALEATRDDEGMTEPITLADGTTLQLVIISRSGDIGDDTASFSGRVVETGTHFILDCVRAGDQTDAQLSFDRDNYAEAI